MRLVSFTTSLDESSPRVGALLDDSVVDLQAVAETVPPSLQELLKGGPSALQAAQQALDSVSSTSSRQSVCFSRDDVRLLPPITSPHKVLCIGKNNKGHLEELKRNALIREVPREPTGFIKLNEVLVGDRADVVRPEGITTMDYEPELTFIVGKRAFRTRKEDAMEHVAAITLLNDLTAREIQKQEVVSGTRFWTSKNMPGFGPIGPFVITLDEVHDPHDLWIICDVNGKRRMRVHTGDVIFRIGDVIEHFSRWMPLEPGDIIAMGAPAGVAVGQPNADELYLKPGDVVEIAFEGLPPLTTRIIQSKGQG